MYLAALQLSPAVPNVYISLASISPPPENARLFRKAIALRPTEPDAYARLAAALAPVPLGGAEPPSEASLRGAMAAMRHASTLAPLNHHHHAELGRLPRALAAAADPVRGVGDRARQVRALDMRIGW